MMSPTEVQKVMQHAIAGSVRAHNLTVAPVREGAGEAYTPVAVPASKAVPIRLVAVDLSGTGSGSADEIGAALAKHIDAATAGMPEDKSTCVAISRQVEAPKVDGVGWSVTMHVGVGTCWRPVDRVQPSP